MVMGNAFEQGETLLFDHLHRRSRESKGLIEYPAAVLKAHEEFTQRMFTKNGQQRHSKATQLFLHGFKDTASHVVGGHLQ